MKLRQAATSMALLLPLTVTAMDFKPLTAATVVHHPLITPMEFEGLPDAGDFFNGGLELVLNPALLPQQYKVTMYSTPDCVYCVAAVKAIEENFPDCNLVKIDDINQHPQWVRNLNGVPVFYWETNNGSWKKVQGWHGVDHFETVVMKSARDNLFEEIPGDAQPTDFAEVRRVLGELKPKKSEVFIDYGCGYDARFCILAAKKYGCESIGIEYDEERAALAQKHVEAAGVENLVTIIHGDATEVEAVGDVAVAYLFPDTLKKLKPRLEHLDRFASLQHPVEGIDMRASGDAYIWSRPAPQQQNTDGWVQPYAIYGNRKYYGRVCNKGNCGMCNKIAYDIANFKQPNQIAQAPQPQYKRVKKYCKGKFCGYILVPVN